MSEQMNKMTDYAAGSAGITIPVWVNLAQINDALTTISLLLGIALMLWRVFRGAQRKGED